MGGSVRLTAAAVVESSGGSETVVVVVRVTAVVVVDVRPDAGSAPRSLSPLLLPASVRLHDSSLLACFSSNSSALQHFYTHFALAVSSQTQ